MKNLRKMGIALFALILAFVSLFVLDAVKSDAACSAKSSSTYMDSYAVIDGEYYYTGEWGGGTNISRTITTDTPIIYWADDGVLEGHAETGTYYSRSPDEGCETFYLAAGSYTMYVVEYFNDQEIMTINLTVTAVSSSTISDDIYITCGTAVFYSSDGQNQSSYAGNGSCQLNIELYQGNTNDYINMVAISIDGGSQTYYNPQDRDASYGPFDFIEELNVGVSTDFHRVLFYVTIYADNPGESGGSSPDYGENAPELNIGTPQGGYIYGSGTSTIYYGVVNGTVLIDFWDESCLEYYSNSSYYRYSWSESTSSHPGYISIAGTRTSTNVYEYVTMPSTPGLWYLWVEGDVKDDDGNYMSNDTNIEGLGPSDSSARIFEFVITSTSSSGAPTLTISKPVGSTAISGTGTSTVYYGKPSASVTITFEDETSLQNYSSNSYYRYAWSTSSTTTPSWTAISGTRTSKKVSGTISLPSSAGTHYLWIEGDVKDSSGNYMSNDTNINGYGSSTSSHRKFKFIVDNTAPTVWCSSTQLSNSTTRVKTDCQIIIKDDNSVSSLEILGSSSSALSDEIGASGTSFTYHSILTVESSYTLNFCDIAGNAVTKYLVIDKTAPDMSTSGTSTSWTNGNRTVTISTNAGDIAAYYCNNSWISSVANDYVCTFSTNTITATVGVKDDLGNQRTSTVNIYIDKTNPTIDAIEGASTTWTNGNRTITISGDDNISPAAYYCNGAWNASVANDYACTFSTNTITATVGVKDAAGNQVTQTVNVYVDKTNPTIDAIEGASTTWTNANRTIIISGDDNISPAAYYCNGAWNATVANDYVCTFSTNTITATVGVKDAAGNQVTQTVNVYVDKTNPTIDTIDGASTTWTNANRTITISGNDNVAPAAYYCNGAWKTSAANDYVCTFSSTTKTATIGVKDNAGNQVTQTVNVYVDKTNPTIDAIEGASTAWTASDRTIIISGDDSTTNVAAYYCNGTWNATVANDYVCTFSSTTKTATVGVKDAVGNQVTQTVNVYVDKTAPSLSSSGASTTWASSRTITITASDANVATIGGYYCNGAWANSTATSYICKITSATKTTTIGVKDSLGNSTTSSVNAYVDPTKPVWTTSNVSTILTGGTVTVTLTDAGGSGIWSYSSAATYYKYAWTTSSSTAPTSWNTTFTSNTSSKVSFSVNAPLVSDSTTYYLWIANAGKDAAGNIPTASGKAFNNTVSAYNTSVVYKYTINAAGAVLSKATVSGGKITFTKSSSNNLQTTYANGTVTYFIGKPGIYNSDLDAAFDKYGVTVSASTFFGSSLVSPQGLVGDVELYTRISATGLNTLYPRSGTINITNTGSSTKTFSLFIEDENNESTDVVAPVALSSNVLNVTDIENRYSGLMFALMLVVSIVLAFEVIVIKKNKKAHN